MLLFILQHYLLSCPNKYFNVQVTIPINECTDAPADTYASSFNPVPQNVLRILIGNDLLHNMY